MNEEENTKVRISEIPGNIIENKTYFKGKITYRKMIEGCVLAAITFIILYPVISGIFSAFGAVWTYGFTTSILVAGIMFFLGAIGIKGQPISVFLKMLFSFKSKKDKTYDFPDEDYLAERELSIQDSLNIMNDEYRKNAELKRLERKRKKKQREVKQREHKVNQKQSAAEKRQKLEERKIKESLIASGLTPAEVAAINVFGDKKQEKEAIDQGTLKKQSLINRQKERIKENIQNSSLDKDKQFIGDVEIPPITTTAVDFLPFQSLAGGVLKTTDNRYVKIIEIVPTEFNLKSPKEKNDIIDNFAKYLQVAPAKFHIKCISHKADTRRHVRMSQKFIDEEKNDKCKELQQELVQTFQNMTERGSLEKKFLMIFEFVPMFNDSKVETELTAINVLQQVADDAKSILSNSCSIGVRTFDEDNYNDNKEDMFIVKTLYEFINRNESSKFTVEERRDKVASYYYKAFKNPEYFTHIPLNELIAPKKIDFSAPDYIVVDDRYYTYHYIPGNELPTLFENGWMVAFSSLSEGIDTDFFFERKDSKITMDKAKVYLNHSERNKIYNQKGSAKDMFDVNNNRMANAIYVQSKLREGEQYYNMNVLITVSADSLEELKERDKILLNACTMLSMKLADCEYIEDKAFLSSLPLCQLDPIIKGPSTRNIMTTGISAGFPFIANNVTDDNGILIGQVDGTNELAIVDLFNTEKHSNANVTLWGTPGAGKTFALQTFALRFREMRIPTYIVSPLKAHEFRRLANAVDGTFITISPSSNNCVNIMDIRKRDSSVDLIMDGVNEKELVSELIEKINTLKIFFRLIYPEITSTELNLLDGDLVETYRLKGITADNNSLFIEGTNEYKEMPILGDAYNVIQKNHPEELKGVLSALATYVYGSAKNFNQQTNVNLDNLFTVFDIEHLPNEILPVGMLIVIDYLWLKIKEDRTRKKAVIFDELWKLISANSAAANYVLEIWRIIRGYGGAAIGATQSTKDLGNETTAGIDIANISAVKFIFHLEVEDIKNVQKFVKLTPNETSKVLKLRVGHCLAFFGENNFQLYVSATEKEQQIFTTDPNKQAALYEKKKKTYYKKQKEDASFKSKPAKKLEPIKDIPVNPTKPTKAIVKEPEKSSVKTDTATVETTKEKKTPPVKKPKFKDNDNQLIL